MSVEDVRLVFFEPHKVCGVLLVCMGTSTAREIDLTLRIIYIIPVDGISMWTSMNYEILWGTSILAYAQLVLLFILRIWVFCSENRNHDELCLRHCFWISFKYIPFSPQFNTQMHVFMLTYCGILTPCGVIDLCQYLLVSCHVGDKPLPATHYQFELLCYLIEFLHWIKYILKCRLQNGSHFIQASMCFVLSQP